MKIHTLIIAFLIAVPSYSQNLESALKDLDRIIENRAVYAAEAEDRLKELKGLLGKAETPEDRYFFMDRIEEKYRFFNLDSCFAYIGHKKELAHIIGDESYICGYNLNYADVYIKSGYFREAQEILDKLEGNIPDELYGYYLKIMESFYEFQMESAKLSSDKEYYQRMLKRNREEQLSFFQGEKFILAYFRQAISTGDYDIAKDYLTELLSTDALPHLESTFLYLLSDINRYKGEDEERMYNLALTARNDITEGIREYKALSELAIMLYSKGDLDRAENYLKAAMDDASLCYARPRYMESFEFFTSIDKAFNRKLKTKNTYIIIALIISIILALGMTVLTRTLYRYNKRLTAANLDIRKAHDSISEVNRRLNESYNKLKETTIIKDEYIGMYMDQCSLYLSKLDNYRKSLRKMLKLGNLDTLQKTIPSEDFIRQEVKEFHANFDIAFLHLYPTFPEDFNSLLKEEERIPLASPGKLNTELRVYALIRLGIDDSAKIAQFLRYSVQTIYNCRTQMRNKAKGDRNQFENQVMKIGIS